MTMFELEAHTPNLLLIAGGALHGHERAMVPRRGCDEPSDICQRSGLAGVDDELTPY